MTALTHLFLGVGVVIKWVIVDLVKVEQMNRILEWTELSFFTYFFSLPKSGFNSHTGIGNWNALQAAHSWSVS